MKTNIHREQAAVVVPIYRSLNEYEKIALKQAKAVLGRYDIIAAIPDTLIVEEQSVFTRMEGFKADYFNSITDYNRLMLSVDFYRRFSEYRYILIYQLDAFVFEDRLLSFCSMGYDYIGAPWLHGVFHYIDEKHNVFYVGNGGLSLRCVDSFIRILEERKPLQEEQIKNEDLFFSSIVSETFKTAPLETALQFSFERQVKECYERNHHKLPFGCHAWERYDLAFWKPYIEREGYVLAEHTERIGNEDAIRQEEYACYARLSAFFGKHFDKRIFRKRIEAVNVCHREFLIFGAGFSGKSLMRSLVDAGMTVKGFCDNKEELWGKEISGYPVFSLNEIRNNRAGTFIVIANAEHERAMAGQLEDSGFKRRKEYLTFTDFVDIVCGVCDPEEKVTDNKG